MLSNLSNLPHILILIRDPVQVPASCNASIASLTSDYISYPREQFLVLANISRNLEVGGLSMDCAFSGSLLYFRNMRVALKITIKLAGARQSKLTFFKEKR